MAKTPKAPKASRIAMGVATARALIESRAATTPAASAPVAAPPATVPASKADSAALKTLVAENRRLAEASEAASANARAAIAAATKAGAQVQALAAENATIKADLGTTRDALSKAQAEIRQLRSAATPRGDGPLVLTSESVSALLKDFFKSFEGGLGTLQLNAGEIKLKTGFALADGRAAFVIPSATAPQDKVEALHELRLQLDPRGAV